MGRPDPVQSPSNHGLAVGNNSPGVLPSVGDKVSKDDPFGVVESVKAVSDIYAPVSGTVIEVNEDLPESPGVVNEDPYGDGWLIKVRVSDPTDFDDLMESEEYEEIVASEKEE